MFKYNKNQMNSITNDKKPKKKHRILRGILIVFGVCIGLCIGMIALLFSITDTTNRPSAAATTQEIQENNNTSVDVVEDYPAAKVGVHISELESESKLSVSEPKKSDMNKIDKYIKNEEFDKLVKLNSKLSDSGKDYLISELNVYFKNKSTSSLADDDDARLTVEENLNAIIDIGLTSDIMVQLNDTLTLIDKYYEDISNSSVYTPIQSEPYYTTVYVSTRIREGSQSNNYTDYYAAYTGIDYIYADAYPNRDSEIIIIHSINPLSQGVNDLYLYENGTYDTIDNYGFEETNRKFEVCSYDQIDTYYYAMQNKEINDQTRILISELGNVLTKISEGDLEDAKKYAEAVIDTYNTSLGDILEI